MASKKTSRIPQLLTTVVSPSVASPRVKAKPVADKPAGGRKQISISTSHSSPKVVTGSRPSLPVSPWNANFDVTLKSSTRKPTTGGAKKKKPMVPIQKQSVVPSHIVKKPTVPIQKQSVVPSHIVKKPPVNTVKASSHTDISRPAMRNDKKSGNKTEKNIVNVNRKIPKVVIVRPSTTTVDSEKPPNNDDEIAPALRISQEKRLREFDTLNLSPSPEQSLAKSVQEDNKNPSNGSTEDDNKENEVSSREKLSSTTAFSMDDLTLGFRSASPRVRGRRSLDSPFGESLPRVFEPRYDNPADALWAPYIVDDGTDSAISSPRFSN